MPYPVETGSLTEPEVGCLSGNPAMPMSGDTVPGLQVTVQGDCVQFYRGSRAQLPSVW